MLDYSRLYDILCDLIGNVLDGFVYLNFLILFVVCVIHFKADRDMDYDVLNVGPGVNVS